ncbi:MAG: TRAP transporter permease [Alphaproteobacteria bacterium]|nr:TRAP transporter permease [Alphaproteobacteria bacterium]
MVQQLRKSDELGGTLILDDLVVENDCGGRRPRGLVYMIMMSIAFMWSIFQLWIASPFPYDLQLFIIDSTNVRYVHLAFASFLAFLAYPAFKSSPRHYVPVIDWLFAFLAVATILYMFVDFNHLSLRPGMPNHVDIGVSILGIVFLLEATRRSLGAPLMIFCIAFLIYIFIGPYLPELLSHHSNSLSKLASHQWLSTEGVFGVAIDVSVSFVFVYVLFSAMLERSGAGNYFIQLCVALLGHLRGGPAKAAVIASAFQGMISGSSVANVVSCGIFTIPLMRRVGFSRERAAAVEVASSVNGQIMPPVMGAAAFLMAEYLGIPYSDVIKNAFIPAVISYIALFYIVHIEAVKNNMPVLTKRRHSSSLLYWLVVAMTSVGISAFCYTTYLAISWLKHRFPDAYFPWLIGGIFAAYILLMWYESRFDELELDDPDNPIKQLPGFWEIAQKGLHHLLPISVLVWLLMVEQMTPELAAFWASLSIMFVLLTQRFLRAFFRKEADLRKALKRGVKDFFSGMTDGARNMVVIGVGTGVAGIIVGAVTLTGFGQRMTEIVEILSNGSVFGMLALTAVVSLILGMGLPTTATYVVVATLMAPVITELSAQGGMIIPAVAVHLFVFYFGIIADITPPVGLASFAGAAVSGGDPTRTGWIAFMYSLRTILIPFLFVYDTQLLLIGVDSVWLGVWVFVRSSLAVILFAAATFNYFVVKSKLYESAILLLVSFMICVPKVAMDIVFPAYTKKTAYDLEESLSTLPLNTQIRLIVKKQIDGEEDGHFRTVVMSIPVMEEGVKGKKQWTDFGLTLAKRSGDYVIKDVTVGSKAEEAGYQQDEFISAIDIPNKQPNILWIYFVAILLTGVIVWLQRKRRISIFQPETNNVRK